MVDYIPSKGDIVWLDFTSQTGREISKKRPALVISPINYNTKTGLAIFMPITSKVKNYPFEITIELKQTKGAILCDQVRSLDWHERNAQKITTLDPKRLKDAIMKLQLLLDG